MREKERILERWRETETENHWGSQKRERERLPQREAQKEND